MTTLFSDEYVLEAYAKEIADKTAYREARETAERFIKKGQMSLENIADCIPSLSLDELKKIAAEITQRQA